MAPKPHSLPETSLSVYCISYKHNKQFTEIRESCDSKELKSELELSKPISTTLISSTKEDSASGEILTLVAKGIPKRFVFSFLGFLGICNAFAMRCNLNIAMVVMVKQPSVLNSSSVESSESCLELVDTNRTRNNSVISHHRGEFDWDTKLQQLILASFYFGYVIAQIPGGIIAEKYHAKHFFGQGILLTAILTLLTPVAARHSVECLIVVRTMQGVVQAVTWPAINTMISRWVPVMERSRVSSFIFSGAAVGVLIPFALCGLLCDSDFVGGWPAVFYFFGLTGCLWFIFWTYLVFESPEVHPGISKMELNYIRKSQDEKTANTSVPWRCILTSMPFWGLVIVHFGSDWGVYTLQAEVPIYLNNILHFDLKQNGVLSAFPYCIFFVVSILSSTIADRLRESNKIGISIIRKILNSFGFYGSGLCLLIVPFAGCSPKIIVILLSLAVGLNGSTFSGFNVTHLDMSPEFAGTLMAITNTVANISGFLAPMFVGWIIQDGNTLKNWGIVFITAGSIYVLCGTIFNIFCSAELQQWNEAKRKPTSQEDKSNIYCTQNDFSSENSVNLSCSINHVQVKMIENFDFKEKNVFLSESQLQKR